mmetsp:Transcript_21042/g.53969  ORF Transcript_21042/g.53969 Transcript_21042/m.53969 type:complete len:223 (+) Transcript_21042:1225-1893(+)
MGGRGTIAIAIAASILRGTVAVAVLAATVVTVALLLPGAGLQIRYATRAIAAAAAPAATTTTVAAALATATLTDRGAALFGCRFLLFAFRFLTGARAGGREGVAMFPKVGDGVGDRSSLHPRITGAEVVHHTAPPYTSPQVAKLIVPQRLDKVVGRAQVEALHHCLTIVLRGHHDHRNLAKLGDAGDLAKKPAGVDARRLVILENEVEARICILRQVLVQEI